MGVLSIVAVAVGALLAFVVEVTSFAGMDGWSLGMVLIATGVVVLLSSLLRGTMFSLRSHRQPRAVAEPALGDRRLRSGT